MLIKNSKPQNNTKPRTKTVQRGSSQGHMNWEKQHKTKTQPQGLNEFLWKEHN